MIYTRDFVLLYFPQMFCLCGKCKHPVFGREKYFFPRERNAMANEIGDHALHQRRIDRPRQVIQAHAI